MASWHEPTPAPRSWWPTFWAVLALTLIALAVTFAVIASQGHFDPQALPAGWTWD